MKIDYELKDCNLLNAETDEFIALFDARAVKEKENRASFIASGIASGGHSYSIATGKKLNFTPYNHAVIIDGVRFIITAKRFITHKPLGERLAKGIKREIVLDLE